MIVTSHNESNNTYSAATALGLICFGASREFAAKAIRAAIPSFTDYQIEHALSYPSDAATWRATLASAMASDLEGLQSQIAEASDSSESERVAVQESITRLSGEIAKAKDDAERERYRADLAHRIGVWEADLKSRVSVVLNDAPNLGHDAAYQLLLNASPGLGRMKKELEELNG
jgi:hypothetical protein